MYYLPIGLEITLVAVFLKFQLTAYEFTVHSIMCTTRLLNF